MGTRRLAFVPEMRGDVSLCFCLRESLGQSWPGFTLPHAPIYSARHWRTRYYYTFVKSSTHGFSRGKQRQGNPSCQGSKLMPLQPTTTPPHPMPGSTDLLLSEEELSQKVS